MKDRKILTLDGLVSVDSLKLGDFIYTGYEMHLNPVYDIQYRTIDTKYIVEYTDGHYSEYASGEYVRNGFDMVKIDELVSCHDFHPLRLKPIVYPRDIRDMIYGTIDIHEHRSHMYLYGALLANATSEDLDVSINEATYQNIKFTLESLGIYAMGIPNDGKVTLQCPSMDPTKPIKWTYLFPDYLRDGIYMADTFPNYFLTRSVQDRYKFLRGLFDSLKIKPTDDRYTEIASDSFTLLLRIQNLLRSLDIISTILYQGENNPKRPAYVLTKIGLDRFYPDVYSRLEYIEYGINVFTVGERLSSMGIKFKQDLSIRRIREEHGKYEWTDIILPKKNMIYFGEDFIPRSSGSSK